jgi:site-specific recombinase XerC
VSVDALTVRELTLQEAARIVREAMRDKSYQLLPLGQDVAGYLRVKRKRLTDSSYLDYESGLDKFARYFPDLRLEDFEPPVGTDRLEEFLDHQWGTKAPRTYNKNLSILRDFFKFQILRGRLHGDPTLAIERARKRDVHRTTFSSDQTRAILAEQASRRDRIALRLLLDYALRKGALRDLQFRHFDHQRRRLTIFTKGKKVRQLPIPDPDFWLDLERHILDTAANPGDYLMCKQKTIPVGKPGADGKRRSEYRYWADQPMSDHGLHKWWYRCLANAGIVPEGVQAGERMHKARHTAGQRVLDAPDGNLQAVQALLGHISIATTGDIYTDWDIDQLARTMAQVLLTEDTE